MGSIFKPSTTVVQAPQQSSTSYDIPPYFKEIQERTLRRAENVFDVPYTAYTGQRIAQLDPSEIQAENIYKNQIIPQSGQLANIANQTYDTATAAAYANPYENQVISGALTDLGEAYGQSRKAMSAQAIGSGAFGGERQGIENVLGRERYLDTVGDTSARLRQAGFESGANRFAQDRAAQLASAQSQIGALGQSAAGMAGFGTQARGIEQAGLAENYRDFIEEREYGAGQIRQMVGALSGAPIRSYGEERSGIKIYNFKYKGDDKKYQGVMAHQVPHASIVNDEGYLMVDYNKLDVEFKEV